MLTSKEIYNQIQNVTVDLIKTGLCDNQNFPSITQCGNGIKEVGITNVDNALFLKNISYSDMYYESVKKKIYHMKMIDGALIYMLYKFKNEKILMHRLSYFPSPDLESFQNNPEVYLEDEIYLDILDRRIVTVPIRFDYDITDGIHEPVEHPISHLTLGQYKNCRIPVSSAVTPYQFVSFITRNFYHTAHEKYCGKFALLKEKFMDCIVKEETEILHICISK